MIAPMSSDTLVIMRVPAKDVASGAPVEIVVRARLGHAEMAIEHADMVHTNIHVDRIRHLANVVSRAANIATPLERPVRHRAKLSVALHHTTYEASRTMWLASQLIHASSPRMSDDDRHTYWSYLEAFLVHARNLQEFLYGEVDAKPSDVAATDFFEDPSIWTSGRPRPSSLLNLNGGTLRHLINKHVAHLTWDRVDDPLPDEAWDQVEEIAQELYTAMMCFRRLAEPTVVFDWTRWKPTSSN